MRDKMAGDTRLKTLTSLGSELLSRPVSVKQDESIKACFALIILQSSVDALSAAFLSDVTQGLIVSFRLFASAFCYSLEIVL